MECSVDGCPKWGLWDLFMWKIAPSRFGGGIPYIQGFKDAWVRHNRQQIKESAQKHNLPPILVAGVCWIEVGGDPNFIDSVAFNFRAFDWSGPTWMDKHLTILNHPAKTSFGSVSMQLRTAAATLGFNADQMSTEELRTLANNLEKDTYNIEIAAAHLRQLVERDNNQVNLPYLSEEQIRIVGARYNRGMGLSLEKIKMNTSYGDFIVKNWQRFSGLIQ